MENDIKVPKKKKSPKNIILIVIQAIIILICLVGAIFILLSNNVNKKDPKEFKTSIMIVKTDSMEPTIKTKTMIFSRKYKEADGILDLATIVTYPVEVKNGFNLITHRIVGYFYLDKNGIEQKKYFIKDKFDSFDDLPAGSTFIGYLTRGDKYSLEYGASLDNLNIRYNDDSINYSKDDNYYSSINNDQILAIYKGQSVLLGNFIWFVQNNKFLMIVLPVMLLILYNLGIVIVEIVNDKKKEAKEKALEEIQNTNTLTEEEIKKKAIEEYLAQLEDEKEET